MRRERMSWADAGAIAGTAITILMVLGLVAWVAAHVIATSGWVAVGYIVGPPVAIVGAAGVIRYWPRRER